METEGILIQILIVVITAGSGWFLLRKQREKMDAEISSITMSTVSGVLDELRTELVRAETRIAGLETKVRILTEEKEALRAEQEEMRGQILHLKRGVAILTGQIKQLGHKPVWTCKEEEDDK